MSKNSKIIFPKGVEVVGSAIIQNSKGEILLVKSPKWSNKWTFPGGHVEPGEKIIDAILRETKEETGISLLKGEIIGFGELINSKDFYRSAHFIYFNVFSKTKNSIVKIDNKELIDYKWVVPKEAIKMNLAGSYRDSIKKFLRRTI